MTPSGITGIDHVLIAVRDLEAAGMGWTRLGFTTSPRGKHLGRGSGNYCIMFGNDYLELFGLIGPEAPSPEYPAFLAEREGAMKLAWSSVDAAAAASALRARGLHPDAVRALSRQIELPEATAVPRFEILALDPAETPGLSSFVCVHLTPELMRRPAWLAHPNGATGIAAVTAVVEDPRALRAQYERIFGREACREAEDSLSVAVGRHEITFVRRVQAVARLAEIGSLSDCHPPFIAALTLTVDTVQSTLDHLTNWQIPHEARDGTVIVPPEEANGVALEFVGRS